MVRFISVIFPYAQQEYYMYNRKQSHCDRGNLNLYVGTLGLEVWGLH